MTPPTPGTPGPGGHPLPTGFSPLVPGDPLAIGPFQLVGRVGEGGMGAVYGALDAAGRQIAVKVIHPRHAADPAYRAQFAREVDLLSRVDAECAPAFLGAAPGAERPWLATEFVTGRTLSEHVRGSGVLTGDALRSFAAGTAEALAAVHAAGVVHRDVKPANIMLSPTGPRVLDFGIARGTGDRDAEAGVYGTPGWIAPERLSGAAATPRADVFAWGGLVVYAATGHGPFGSGDTATLIARTRAAALDLDGVPENLLPLVTRALAATPEERPDAGEAFREVLALSGDDAPEDSGAARTQLRSMLSGAWTGFDVGRGFGPWVAAAGSVALLSGSAAVVSGMTTGAAAAGAAGATGMAGTAAAGAGAAGAGAAGAGAAGAGAGAAAAGAGTVAGMSKATALIVAGVTATTVVTGGWIGGRLYTGEPILPLGAEEPAASPSPEREGQEVSFRGMSVWIPDDWTAETVMSQFGGPREQGNGPTEEWMVLYPGGQEGCDGVEWEATWAAHAPPEGCEFIKVLGPAGIEYGGVGYGRVDDTAGGTEGMYYPASEVPGCPEGQETYTQDDDRYRGDGDWEHAQRPVGDAEASYSTGSLACMYSPDFSDTSIPLETRYLDQRTWLLAEQEILVVDNYGIDAMDDILAGAEWGEAEDNGPQTVEFRALTLELPGSWEVTRETTEFDGAGAASPVEDEWLLVGTDPDTPCGRPDWWGGHYECPHLKILGPGGIGTGFGAGRLTENDPFAPWAEPYTCDPSVETAESEPADEVQTLAAIGERNAFYRVWNVPCTDAEGDGVSTDGPTRYYEQRYWLLPESEILIVDDYRTDGLTGLLESADLPE
ncbi:serine/threonine protein kinase [Nocardiopsis sediminis]|uniref:Serine/threonine protein kinase n=1 Tax=Nocardiopsis sediminis TaxID=1778267 RepID=A0ABV8FI16_9ACTN